MRHLSLSDIATVNTCIILIAILIVSTYTIRPTTLTFAQMQTIIQRDLTIELVCRRRRRLGVWEFETGIPYEKNWMELLMSSQE
jgi:hypothetical protein